MDTIPDTDDKGDKNEFFATLRRGRSFTLGTNPSKVFLRGVDVPVSAKTRARLIAKAIDRLTVGTPADGEEVEQDEKQKFIFRRIDEPAPSSETVARPRTRRVHTD